MNEDEQRFSEVNDQICGEPTRGASSLRKLLCNRDDLKAYILEVYLDKADEINNNIVAITIEAVSLEIIEQLNSQVNLNKGIPATIKNIASVISGYRVVSSVTTMVSSEAMSDNEWLPLQNQYKKALALLSDIATGKQKIVINDDTTGSNYSFAVVTRKRSFDLREY